MTLERWRELEIEIAKHRCTTANFNESKLPRIIDFPILAMPREQVLRFRADYEILLLLLSTLLGHDAGELDPLQVAQLVRREESALRQRFVAMTDEMRVEFVERLWKGFCRYCGRALGADVTCHCENEE